MAVTLTHKMFTPLFSAVALSYLCFHLLHGEQGLYALLVENHHRKKLETELQEVKTERLFLEHKVTLMRDGGIDPDLLDEETRRALGLAGKDEIVVIAPER